MPRSVSIKLLAALCAVILVAAGCHGGNTNDNKPAPSSGSTAQPTSGKPGAAGGGLFDVAQPFGKNISGSAVAKRSAEIIQTLSRMGGWGNGNVLQTDFSIPFFFADRSTPRKQVVGSEEYCFSPGAPDCDKVPAQMPVPANAHFEGSSDLSCDPSGNTENQSDCHLLVAERDEHKLYEIYHGGKKGDAIVAEAFFIWDLKKAYPETLRGDQCTSADAAGFPIAAMLPTADEVASGTVNHPLRFILPNDRMHESVYVRPATHAGAPSSDDPNAPPYGVRFRLKANFDESKYNASEKAILKALKNYGMFLADGGEIALTFADDRTSKAKWESLGIKAESFTTIGVDQFEVVELGNEVPLTYDCVRTP